ncbi:hypothetical protein L6164_016992 [Bauhinia variegata]|uniref:Uncharacterized protein n=1 Tax=Bauhinia variegata TaxID=167791 RepID=A0ACB9N699_BAUVA|nr:hypothetical protein L6164_016992 [Bauhinia variegata]
MLALCLGINFPRKLPASCFRFISFKLASTAFAHLNSATFLDHHKLTDDKEIISSCSCPSEEPSSVHHSYELDTFRVVEELNRLRLEPTVALNFFRQVKVLGFQHNISTYAAVIRILCYWGLDRKLNSLFVELIALAKQNPSVEIQGLFEVLLEGVVGAEGNHQHLLLALDGLVKAYVSLNMFDEAIDFLFQTRRRGIVPHIFTCNFLINRLVGHGQVDMALAIYKQLKRLV